MTKWGILSGNKPSNDAPSRSLDVGIAGVAKKSIRRRVCVIRAACLEALEPRVLLSTAVWTGAADGHWSTGANWQTGAAPSPGDSVVFGADATGKVVTNDTATDVSTFTTTDGYTIAGGGAITVEQGLISSGNSTISTPISLGQSQTFEVDSGTLTLGGSISDSSNGITFTKTGSGTLDLAASESFSGPVIVNSGTLQLDAPLASDVEINNGATLSGAGALGNLNSIGGTVSPGDEGAGALSTGAVTLDANSVASFELDGNTAGNGAGHYSQISASGGVSLGGATLSLTIGPDYSPAGSDTLTIIAQTGNTPVIGTFSGLPEGALVTVGSSIFRISYQGGAGNDVTLTHVRNTAITVNTDINPSVYGQTVLIAATIVATDGQPSAPTGYAAFYSDGNLLGLGYVDPTTGVSTFESALLGVGTHTLTASYEGDADMLASTSSGAFQLVNKAATSTTISVDNAASDYGQTVTFTASVLATLPGTGHCGGTVTFMDGTTPIGTASVNGFSQAIFSTGTLSVGSHSITAVYGGSNNFLDSVSSSQSEVTFQDETTTTLTQSPETSVVGQLITLTATVAASLPGGGTPDGSVVFEDDSENVLARASLDASGIATSAIALPLGTTVITAYYTGSGSYFASSSTSVSHTTTQAPTQGEVTAFPLTPVSGQAVTLTATFPPSGSGGAFPTGTATFLDGITTLGTGSLDAQGQATLAGVMFAAGDHAITVVYGGDQNNSGSTSAQTIVSVAKCPTAVSLSTSDVAAVYGEALVLTASVSAAGAGSGLPTGDIALMDGSTLIDMQPVTDGIATFDVSGLTAGSHSLSAQYQGDDDFLAGSATYTQSITPSETTTQLTSSGNLLVATQPITFTAIVSPTGNGDGVPTGTVTFTLDGAFLADGMLDNTGQASCTTAGLTAGSHAIQATYIGDGNFASSTSAALIQTDTQDGTHTSLSVAQTGTFYGEAAIVSAVVSPQSPGTGTPTGTVSFVDGSALLGTENLDSLGNATLSISTLSVGLHTVTAVYNSDANFSASASSSVGLTVGKAGVNVTPVATSASKFGQAITLYADVAGSATGAVTPTGSVTFSEGGTELGSGTLDANGVAALSISSLSVGVHEILASYSGDANFNANSASLNQEIDAGNTAVGLSSDDAGASEFGQTINYTATVSVNSPAVGVPTGIVNFTDENDNLLGSGTVNAATGTVTLAINSLAAGSHTITATYLGDSNFDGSSDSLTQTVAKAATTLATTVDDRTTVFGQSATFTATIAVSGPGAGSPTGSITFTDENGNILGDGPIPVVNNQAVLSVSSLAVGNYTVTATYSGSANFLSSAGTQTGTVARSTTATNLTTSDATGVFGEMLTFTATVAATGGGSGTPAGTVTFGDDNGNLLGVVSLNDQGQATYSSALPIGSDAVIASYGGDGNYDFSASVALNEPVVKDSVTLTATAASSDVYYGQSDTLTVNASATSPGMGTPSGIVNFEEDGSIGSNTLDDSGQTSISPILPVGNHSVTAQYVGDADFEAQSAAVSFNVIRGTTSTAMTTNVTTGVFGQSVTYTAAVSVTHGAGAPSGFVAFEDENGNTLGTAILADGVASFTGTGLPVGVHSVEAVYQGDANFTGSSSSSTPETIGSDATTTTLNTSGSSTWGHSLTLTAGVVANPPGSGIPDGTVVFVDGGNPIGSGTLDETGHATFTTNLLSPGSHSLSAVYEGDGGSFDGSVSSPSTESIAQEATHVTLSTSVANPVVGQPVTFKISVSSAVSGLRNPTGNVSLFDEAGNELGDGTVIAGQASFVVNLPVGSHTLLATYGGDTYFSGANGDAPESVGQASTITTLTASAETSVFGQPVSFTATVAAASPGAGTPTGTVTFADQNGTVLATGTLDNNGTSTIFFSGLGVGSNAITASYRGDASFLPSGSGGLSHPVSQAAVSLSLASSAASSVFGQPVTFSATAYPIAPGAGTPDGLVTFFDDNDDVLGSAALAGSGHATITTAALSTGSHTVIARYEGDENFDASQSALLNLSTGSDSTTTTVVSSNSSTVAGQSVIFTATVLANAPGTGNPTGQVTFENENSVTLGTGTLSSDGTATLSLSTLPVGSHTITAYYDGDASFSASSSSAISQNVGLGSVAVAIAPTSPAVFGQPVTISASVVPVSPAAGTASGLIMFYADGIALGSGLVVNGEASVVTSSLPVGSDSITATYAGDSSFAGATASLTQTVNSPPITASDVSTSYSVGQTATLRPLSNASDSAGDALTLSLLTGPQAGSVSLINDASGQYFTYTAGPGDIAPDSFTYQISNGTGSVVTQTATVVPTGIGYVTNPFNPAQQDLVIVTDDSNDAVKIVGKAGGKIAVTINGAVRGTFKPTGRVVVMAGAGNDSVIATATTTPCWFYGGSGNDTLTGGSGNDVLVGGSGSSLLNGMGGHNLLIGGSGIATLQGGTGTNILVGGATSYDDPSTISQTALEQLLVNWNANAGTKTKLHQVSAAPGPSLSLNTVSYDNQRDLLLGNSRSWFIGRSSATGGSDVFYNGKKIIQNAATPSNASPLITSV